MFKQYLSKLILFMFLFGIGNHSFSQATDLFISEYAEGGSFNKYIEIYNGTGASVTMSNYELKLYTSAKVSPSQSITLSGTLSDGDVFIACHTSADTAIKNKADLMSGSLINFNGDDAIALFKNGVMIDIVGDNNGTDPGSGWTVGATSNGTKDHTLVRKSTICNGNTNWTTSSDTTTVEWDIHAKDTWTFLGSHTANCGTSSGSGCSASSALAATNITDTTATLSWTSTNSLWNIEWGVSGFIQGTGVGTMLSSQSTTSISITGLKPGKSYDFYVQDTCAGTGSSAWVGPSTFTTSKPIPHYSIGTINKDDSNGAPDSIDVFCSIQGIVTSIDFDGNDGYSFYIQDSTGGINLWKSSDYNTYQVISGDEVKAYGTIDSYRGLTELVLDSIKTLSSGNKLPKAKLITQLNASVEGELVLFENARIVDAAEWSTSNTSKNIDFINNLGDTITIRIDFDSYIFDSLAIKTGDLYDITGVVGQFASSSSAPYSDGYQLWPNTYSDFSFEGNVCDNMPVKTLINHNEIPFCNGVTVFAHGDSLVDTYLWSNGDEGPTTFLSIEDDTTDFVALHVKMQNGCEFNLDTFWWNPLEKISSYTLLTRDDITLGKGHKVETGAVGATRNSGRITLDGYAEINEDGWLMANKTRVRANAIAPLIFGEKVAIESMPKFLMNKDNSDSYTTKTIGANKVRVVSDNEINLLVKRDSEVKLKGNKFGWMVIQAGAKISFTERDVWIDSLVIKGSISDTTSIHVLKENTSFRIKKYVSFDKNTLINPEKKALVMYVGHTDNDGLIDIYSKNTVINSSIYTPKGVIQITKGSRSDTSYFTGRFIADQIDAKKGTVIWNWANCEALTLPKHFITKTSNNSTQNTSTLIEDVLSQNTNGLAINITPNPTSGQTQVVLTSPKMGIYTIELISLDGKLIQSIETHKQADNINLSMDFSEFSKGMYFVKINDENTIHLKRLIVK